MKNIVQLTLILVLVLGFVFSLVLSTDWSASANWIDMLSLPELADTGPQDTNIETSKVTRVVDGDTIELSDGRKIRYLNVDTPETVKPSTPVMCYGNEAKEANKNQVEGREVWLRWDKEKQDRYGRDLRIIYLNKEDAVTQKIANSVNAFLIKGGFGRSISYAPNKTYKKDFDSLMQTAIDSKTGVWGKCPNPFES